MGKSLCAGLYTSQQVPGAVIVFANGWHPTGGYTVWLEEALIGVYPPEFILYHTAPAPGTIVTQQITPFTKVWAMFEATKPVKKVVVHDVTGKHEVDVEQTPDLKSLCASGRIMAMSADGGPGEIPTPFSTQFAAGGDIPIPFGATESRLQKVLSVDSITLQLHKSNPPILSILAHGKAGSPGWQNSQLIPYVYIMPPKDGIWDFDFVAEPPQQHTIQVPTPISAQATWRGNMKSLRGVRIHASGNDMEQLLG